MDFCTTGGARPRVQVTAPVRCSDLCAHRPGLCSLPLAARHRAHGFLAAASDLQRAWPWALRGSERLSPSSPLPCPVLVPRAGGDGAVAAHRSSAEGDPGGWGSPGHRRPSHVSRAPWLLSEMPQADT